MPRPREYDDSLRLRLIERAAQLLVDEGPAAVTTRRVAAAENTSTTAIYSLIGAKDDLIRAICLEGFTRLSAHLSAVPTTDDPLLDLRDLGRAYYEMAVESPALYRTMFEINDLGAKLSPEEQAFTLSTLQVLIDAVARGVGAGLFTGDPEQLALQLWAVGHGVASLSITGMLGPPERARALRDELSESFSAGLQDRAARAR